MKLTKCPNGHYYDAEKYSSCPHCNGGLKSADDVPTSPITGARSPEPSGDYTIPIYQPGGNAAAQAPSAPKPASAGTFPSSQQGSQPDDDGKTIGFMSWNAPGNEKKNAPENVFQSNAGSQKEQTSPVVGWLVCIKGESYGRSFNLYAGKNFIGRSEDMDIRLSDPTVARNRHAIIIYEPIRRQFFAQVGESHELFYINDNVVLTSTELNDRDVLMIGSAQFIFVPFCDSRFGWIEDQNQQ